MSDLFIWITTLVLGVVITIIATEPIQYLMARTFGVLMIRPPRGVKGIWRTSYSYRGRMNETKKLEFQLIEFKQFGSYVVGKVLAGQTHDNIFKGRIKHEIFFTGTWETGLKSEIYHGAFQFVLDVHGTSMKGKWIGFNKQHQVDFGDWDWSLVSDKIDRKTIEKCVNDFHKEYGLADEHAKN